MVLGSAREALLNVDYGLCAPLKNLQDDVECNEGNSIL